MKRIFISILILMYGACTVLSIAGAVVSITDGDHLKTALALVLAVSFGYFLKISFHWLEDEP